MQTTLDRWLTDKHRCNDSCDFNQVLRDQQTQIAGLLLAVESLQKALKLVTELVIKQSRSNDYIMAVERTSDNKEEKQKKDELEGREYRMEVEKKIIGKVRRRRYRKRPNKKIKVEWVESPPAALPPSRARRRKFDRQPFRWVEIQSSQPPFGQKRAWPIGWIGGSPDRIRKRFRSYSSPA